VITRELPLDEAKSLGAMALFGEKYGEIVRVVDIGGPFSRELCAGTHVTRSSQIGMINLLGESSIGSTTRRVESLVGIEAFHDFAIERSIVSQLSTSLRAPRDEVATRVADLMVNLKAAEKKIAAFEASALTQRVPALVAESRTLGSYRLVAANVGELKSSDELRSLVTSVRDRLGAAASVVALAATVAEKPVVIVATNDAARGAGQKAGALARQAATILGGGGGGKDDLAQGGGTDVQAIDAALAAITLSVSG
jgi:alanyl-tRNA synthetase